jgi:hypothetical protein
MTIQVHAPNGATVEFPVGTPTDVITSVMAQHFGGPGARSASPSMSRGLLKETAEGVPLLGGVFNRGVAALEAAATGGEASSLPESQRSQFDTFGKRYNRFLNQEEESDKAFEQEHPYAATAANIVGGAAATGALGMTGVGARALGLTGKTLMEMVKGGAKSGAVIGGLDAAVRGGDPAEGAIAGGLGGAAGPLVSRGLGEIAAPVARVVRGLRDPDAEAARRVSGALSRDVSTGNPGLNRAEFG